MRESRQILPYRSILFSCRRSGGASGMLGTARLLGQTLGTTLVALLFRMFPEGDRAQACLFLAILFAIGAGVVSSIRMTQASPAGKKY